MLNPPRWYPYFSFFVLAILFMLPEIGRTFRIGIQVLLMGAYLPAFFFGKCNDRAALPIVFVVVLATALLSSSIGMLLFPDIPPGKLFGRTLAFVVSLLSILALWACVESKTLMRALRVYSFTIVGMGWVLFLYYWFVGPLLVEGRLLLGQNPNILAMTLVSAVPGLLWRMNRTSVGALVALLLLVVMAGSRSSLLGVTVLLVTWTVLEWRVQVSLVIGAVMALVALLIGTIWLLDLPFAEHLFLEETFIHRFRSWYNALVVWWENPVSGVGLGMHGEFMRGRVGEVSLPFGNKFTHAHNELIALLADIGVVGALPWVMVLVVAAGIAWRRRHEDDLSRLALAVFAGYVVVGLAETMYVRGGHMLWYVSMLLLLRHLNVPQARDLPLLRRIPRRRSS